MLYGVKIYDKFMNLVEELTPKQVLKNFWKDKEKSLQPTPYLRRVKKAEFKNSKRKRDNESNTTGNNTRGKGKKRIRRSRRAR